MEPEEEKPDDVPDMSAAQLAYAVVGGQADAAAKTKLLATIEAKAMAPWYASLSAAHPQLFPPDAALVARLKALNDAEFAAADAARDVAEKDAGDQEVLDAMFLKARAYARIGDRDGAYAAYGAILGRPKVSTGRRIDAIMQKIRVALFHLDSKQVRTDLDAAAALIDAGGDWDRRNRLKVYEAFYLMTARDLKKAAGLLLECTATFTCSELCSYRDFVLYAVITNVLALPRTRLKTEVIEGPEVAAELRELPALSRLVAALYGCDYEQFFRALSEISDIVAGDRYLGRHAVYVVRELRVLSYAQFLEAYKSVVTATMAKAFGVSVPFLDAELNRFIAAGRLNAKIDKVGGVVETNRPDRKNAQYQAAIKQGDLLLNRVQKLSRVIDV
ncbi:unnamed protein product [Phaeothamnion confervicola]